MFLLYQRTGFSLSNDTRNDAKFCRTSLPRAFSPRFGGKRSKARRPTRQKCPSHLFFLPFLFFLLRVANIAAGAPLSVSAAVLALLPTAGPRYYILSRVPRRGCLALPSVRLLNLAPIQNDGTRSREVGRPRDGIVSWHVSCRP